MKLVIPKSIPNVHLLQADRSHAVPPLSGAYPVFHDGAKSGRRPVDHTDGAGVPLGDLLATACQLASKQLRDCLESLSRNMNSVERRRELIGACLRLRELFFKLAILTDFLLARRNDIHLAQVMIKMMVILHDVIDGSGGYGRVWKGTGAHGGFPRLRP